MIIGKITVMNQGFIQAAEGMGSTGVPYPSLSGIALMRDPAVGLEIFQIIVLGDLFSIADDF